MRYHVLKKILTTVCDECERSKLTTIEDSIICLDKHMDTILSHIVVNSVCVLESKPGEFLDEYNIGLLRVFSQKLNDVYNTCQSRLDSDDSQGMMLSIDFLKYAIRKSFGENSDIVASLLLTMEMIEEFIGEDNE